uniref:HERV-H LTR-associating 2 n=1 Tax=Otus sunia TaxID=257818 RepID=A0A8C8E962_9STRI
PVSWTITSFFPVMVQLLGFTEQETVTGLFSKDCILPCPFPPGDDEVIYWSKEGKIVHRYYYQKDQLEGQDPNYRHRTQLFHENIPRGNASLKLSDLTLTDEGTYKCYVGTLQTPVNVEVMLHVRVSSHYALEYQKIDTEMMLKCYAFLTYPAPNISWVQGNTSIQETHREETKAGVLYSLRSDQKITNTNDTYYCRILLPYEEWAAEWKMQGRNEWNSLPRVQPYIPKNHGNIWFSSHIKNAVLASCNGTCHSYQPRVHINQSDFSLMFDNLTTSDSGEYLCNISAPRYTKLTVRTLQIGKLLLFLFWRMGTSEGNAKLRVLSEICKILRKFILCN